MATATISTPSKADNAWELPSVVKTALGYASLAYTLGFITILVSTARYGVAGFDFIRPVYLWVGATPVLLVVSAIRVFRGWRDLCGKGCIDQSFSWTQVLHDMFGVSMVTFTAYVLSWLPYGVLYELVKITNHGVAYDSLVNAWRHEILWGVTLLLTLIGLWCERKRRKLVIPTEQTIDYNMRYVITGAVAVFLILYIGWLYWMLPQRFGFGKPTKVELVLDGSLLDGNAPSLKGTIPEDHQVGRGSGALWRTRDIELLYRTDAEYLVRPGGQDEKTAMHVISVPASLVKEVIWTSPTPPPK
jgi:hypothetical protein